MKIKIKFKKKLPTQIDSTSVETDKLYDDYNHFIFSCRSYQYSIPQLRSFLAQEYYRLFPSKPYPDGVSLELVRLAIAYEIIYRSYVKAKLPIPIKVAQNRFATQKFSVSSLTEEMRNLIELKLLYNREGLYDMKTVDVTAKKPGTLKPSAETIATNNEKKKTNQKLSTRLTVANAYIALFDRVAKGEKMTDLKLAQEMRRQFPYKKPYTEKDIHTVRLMYNRGGIKGQTKAPEVKIEKYEITKKK